LTATLYAGSLEEYIRLIVQDEMTGIYKDIRIKLINGNKERNK
jgi:hypothetical protein